MRRHIPEDGIFHVQEISHLSSSESETHFSLYEKPTFLFNLSHFNAVYTFTLLLNDSCPCDQLNRHYDMKTDEGVPV
jgi:hypothetical protein